jgi:isopentenyl-diphosphate delta-isomerase
MAQEVVGQDMGELFDVLPDPSTFASLEDPDVLVHIMAANEGQFHTVTRKKAHAEGFWHRSIGIWLFTDDGRVFLQKRSIFKDTNPGKWQISAAGHVSSGQSVIEAVIAETNEEIGVKLEAKDIKFVGLTTRSETGQTERFGAYADNEYKFVFACRVPADVKTCLNATEVEILELKEMDPVFDRFRAEDPAYCPMNAEFANRAQKLIKTELKLL